MVPITFNRVFKAWMHMAVLSVKTEAIRLVSGPLIKISSGTLINGFFTQVLLDGHLGIIGNRAPHAYKLELFGLGTEVLKAPPGKPFAIVKRGAAGPRSQKGVIYRQTIKPGKSKFRKPVRFLTTALINEMTGERGRIKYVKLAHDVGFAVVLRYTSMLERHYGPNMSVTGLGKFNRRPFNP